jgi:hypothetical protein
LFNFTKIGKIILLFLRFVSGTGIIRPGFPELKEWPYFWQQTEYVLGGGATNFMFLVLAAKSVLR